MRKNAQLCFAQSRKNAPRTTRFYEKLGRATTDPQVRASLDDVISRRAVFRQETDAFIQQPPADLNHSSIHESINPSLLAAFIEYQKSCDHLGDVIEAKSRLMTDQVKSEVAKLRLLFFGVGILPISLGLIMVLLMLYLIRTTPIDLDLHEENAWGQTGPRARKLHPSKQLSSPWPVASSSD